MEIGPKNSLSGLCQSPSASPAYRVDSERPEMLHLWDWLKDALDDINTAITETKLPEVKLKGVELNVSTGNGHVRIVI